MSTVEVTFNPFDPAFAQDPYPQWELLREHDPVHRTPVGFSLLLRYDDVQAFRPRPGTERGGPQRGARASRRHRPRRSR